MKKLISFLATVILHAAAFAQSVGIGTASPNASAALDVSSTNKGLLVPRIFLQSAVDKTTIPAPAPTLLIYNTNSALPGGTGFYFNDGNSTSANWLNVSDFRMPYYNAHSGGGAAFRIDDYSASTTSTALFGYSAQGKALETSGKLKLTNTGQPPALGKVLTSDAEGNATWEGAVAFAANGIVSGTRTIPGFAVDKVDFASEAYDLSSNYNAATSTFVAPVTGIYHFDVMITWDDNASTARYGLYLMKRVGSSASAIAVANDEFTDLYDSKLISIDVRLTAGTEVWADLNHSSSNDQDLQTAASENYFNGRLVIKL